MLDRYAQFHKSPADDVVNEALEYIFTKDKEFQQQLAANPDAKVEGTLRVKAPTGAARSGEEAHRSRNSISKENASSVPFAAHAFACELRPTQQVVP